MSVPIAGRLGQDGRRVENKGTKSSVNMEIAKGTQTVKVVHINLLKIQPGSESTDDITTIDHT